MKTENIENKIWIRIQINNKSELEGKEELVTMLRELCPVQERKIWYPSACTGMEFLLSLNFNLSIIDFLNNVLIPGGEYWLLSETVKKIWSVFSDFLKKNKGSDLQKLDFIFDDVIIEITHNPSYGTLLGLYRDFPRHIKILQKQSITEISKIVMPYKLEINEDEGTQNFVPSYWDEEEQWWRVEYLWGCENCFYNPSTEKLIKFD